MPVQPIRDPKARQWLDLLAYAEGTDKSRTGQGYNVMFGGGTFNDLRRHPDKVVNAPNISSAAAGRYQFMPSTWSGVSKKLGVFTCLTCNPSNTLFGLRIPKFWNRA